MSIKTVVTPGIRSLLTVSLNDPDEDYMLPVLPNIDDRFFYQKPFSET